MGKALDSLETSLNKVELEIKRNVFILMKFEFESLSEEDKMDTYYKYKRYMVRSKLLTTELFHAYEKIEYLKWLLRQKKKSIC